MQPSSPTQGSGQIHNLAELQSNTKQPCEVAGTYVWVDPRQDPDPLGAEPPVGCQAAVRLADGALVYLQPTWEPEAARPLDELKQYRDKEVVVTGLLLPEGPPAPDGRAYIQGPCFMGGVVVTQRSTWDMLHGGAPKF